MTFYRVFSDDEGVSRFEESSMEESDLFESVETEGRFFLKRFPAGTEMDWHTAPRRMLVISLQGVLENEFRDGTRIRLAPGDIKYIEDTAGTGHRTRVTSDEDVIVAIVTQPGHERPRKEQP